jgi:uncharacterized membrane protein YcaP (DUF421 family)
MNIFFTIFGEGTDLAAGQMAARATAMFFVTLVLIRLSGRRSFGQRSAFDACTTVLIGAILSRAVVGASPFWGTVAAATALVLLHRVIGWLSVRSDAIDRLVSGRERLIVVDGHKQRAAMVASLISDRDLDGAVRKKIGDADFGRIVRATLERDGEVSLLAKP